MRRAYTLSLLSLMLFIGAGCGGGDQQPEDDGVIVLRPVLNEMRYEQTEIRARAGTTIRVVLDNIDTNPAMSHNFVLLENRDIINEVGIAGAAAGPENDYIPGHEGIIAHTPMASPTERVEVEFTVPPPGEYPYICTYPGHYAVMQGTLYSEE